MDRYVSGYSRILAVLDAVVADPGAIGVRRLSQTTGVARSTVGRILQSLEEASVVGRLGNGDYKEGSRLQVLMAHLRRYHPLLQSLSRHGSDLARRVSSTVLLAIYLPVRGKAFIVSVQRHAGPVEYALEVGSPTPLHAGSTGQAIASIIGPQSMEADNLAAYTTGTITDREELEAHLAQVRVKGYVVSAGQHIELAAGAAAPLRAYGLVGSISVSRPRYSTSSRELEFLGESVMGYAHDIESTALNQVASEVIPSVPYFPAGSTAVARLLRLLALIIRALPNGVVHGSRVADAIGATPATARGLINDLLRYGALTYDGDVLRAGPALLLWSARVDTQKPIFHYAETVLQGLSIRTGQTVGLVELAQNSGRAVMTRVIRGAAHLSYGLFPGGDVPLHAGAAGKAILAYCPQEILSELQLEEFTDRTLTDPNSLRKELDAIMKRGYATSEGERMPDAHGVSAPFFIQGNVKGSLTVTIPRSRRTSINERLLIESVMAASRELTELLSV